MDRRWGRKLRVKERATEGAKELFAFLDLRGGATARACEGIGKDVDHFAHVFDVYVVHVSFAGFVKQELQAGGDLFGGADNLLNTVHNSINLGSDLTHIRQFVQRILHTITNIRTYTFIFH